MDNSIYVALSKQVVTERQMGVIANNIANSSTAGYKSESVFFNQYLMNDASRKTAYVQDLSTFSNLAQGNLEKTNNPLDLAIMGEGYFAIQTPNGEAYTRAGNFTINEQGDLTTMDGLPVLDDAGQPITFQEDDEQITVFANGMLEVDGEERGTIGVYNFENPHSLKKGANNLLYSSEVPVINEYPKLAQGMIENSNVQPIVEMTKLIEVQRDYERTSKYINTLYELQENAIRTIGSQQ